ncbi:transposase [Shewanella surugensis]|uniref:Transposase n=1 Tax=Shewanella surugensis TaxID=212020 RepID=A0ABT0LFP2_9GAMM|nr:transposase [Shewanella surugensis]MCL1126526.1 transposase [Shewanella surugensis]
MTECRKKLIHIDSTPFYHISNYCVRGAYLVNDNPKTKQVDLHRAHWFVDKLIQLSTIFCIDIAAYTILPRHYHLVLKVNTDNAKNLTSLQVIERWRQVFNPHVLAIKYINKELFSNTEQEQFDEFISQWRERLTNISWFMRCLNETISRKVNKEDHCKGAFWQGRFKSQALLDEPAILACIMYVDLAPIREQLAQSLENIYLSSIQLRVAAFKQAQKEAQIYDVEGDFLAIAQQPSTLLPFDHMTRSGKQIHLPFHLFDYIELIKWTHKGIIENNVPSNQHNTPKLLTRLTINKKDWINTCRHFSQHYSHAIGSWQKMCEFSRQFNGKWCKGKKNSQQLHPAHQ